MSVVALQLGQCGNQLGSTWFEALIHDVRPAPGPPRTDDACYREAALERYFHSPKCGVLPLAGLPEARAVLVDMERKVVARSVAMAARSGEWRYADGAAVCRTSGSANNWAYGFAGPGEHCLSEAMESVRAQVERCDRLSGFLAMMSVAGGTGSGLGTRLCIRLRDAYPKAGLLNHLTWPYSTGEVIVQNYNAVLTLAHLHGCSDALLVQQNDRTHRVCAQLLRRPAVSFSHLNAVVAAQLAGRLRVRVPVIASPFCVALCGHHPGELLQALVPHPELKLLSLHAVPQLPESSRDFTRYDWKGLLQELHRETQSKVSNPPALTRRVLCCVAGPAPPPTSLARLLVLRGPDAHATPLGFQRTPMALPWVPPEAALAVWSERRAPTGYGKSATLLANDTAVISPVEHAVSKAWRMFVSRAYVHQYTHHGVSEEDFLDSFTLLEQVIASYRQL
uniref:Tubulin delta chain n=1 Tax=Petromyzon marinus TaxID=7757 RepID=S4RDX3_PETMA